MCKVSPEAALIDAITASDIPPVAMDNNVVPKGITKLSRIRTQVELVSALSLLTEPIELLKNSSSLKPGGFILGTS